MNVLVTGGAGFIGSHIVDALVSRGDDVVVLDSLDPDIYDSAPAYLNAGATYRFVDLRHWSPAPDDDRIDAVVHLAALGGVARASREPANLVAANAAGTARLVESMSRWSSLKVAVLASSFSVYGSGYTYRCRSCGSTRDGTRHRSDLDRGVYEVQCATCGCETDVMPLDESVAPQPLELYGASKYMQELCFRGFSHCPVKVLRQSSVYGPRLRVDDGEATIIARLAGWIRKGLRPPLLEDGGQIRDWVHVSDVVAAVLAVLDGVEAADVTNVCTGSPTRLQDAAVAIAEAMGADIKPEIVGGYREGDMRHCLGDPQRLRDLLGRDPVRFEVGAPATFGSTVEE